MASTGPFNRTCIALAIGQLITGTYAHAATIVVDSGGTCTLGEAIVSANEDSNTNAPGCTAGSGTDTVFIDQPGGTIVVCNNELNGFEITGNATITSHAGNPPIITLVCSWQTSLFRVTGTSATPLSSVTFSNLDLAGGGGSDSYIVGGTFRIQFASVTISNSIVRNAAGLTGRGAGVYAKDSVLHLEDCFFEDNRAIIRGVGSTAGTAM